MILTKKGIFCFKQIGSKVIQGMAKYHSKTPYWIEDDPIIKNYECLRDIWYRELSVSEALRKHKVPRTKFYEIENKFVKYGLVGLYPTYEAVKQNHNLEKLILHIKECRPSLSHTAMLRLAQATPAASKYANLSLISDVLNSHGYEFSNPEGDRYFWQKIQRTINELNRLQAISIKGRDKKFRKSSFFNDADPYHKRLELLREVFFNEGRIKQSCSKLNIPLTTCYRLMREYELFGPWSVLPASLPGSKDTISSELQLNIITTKLRHPKWSAQQIGASLDLKCSRFVISRVVNRWGLEDKDRSPAALNEYVITNVSSEQEFKRKPPAINKYTDEKLLSSRRMNRHFELMCKKMKTHTFHICDPGPILLAPFVNDLGVIQAFETYGPPRLRGKEITNLALLNIMRIISGYRCISHLSNNNDRSAAFASGIGLFGSNSRFYENTVDFTFEQLHNLRNDLVARSIDRGIIRGISVGFDFHFKEFYGKHSSEKGIGKGPDKSGNMVPGFRPHAAWDLAENVIISIAYYQGATRSPRIIKQFCEQNIFSVLDRLAIEEIYMDSEYTKEGDIHYFKNIACKNGDVYICLKKNPQIKKIVLPALKEIEGWESHDNDDERKTLKIKLPHTGLPFTIVVLRNHGAKFFKGNNIRCFGSTNTDITGEDILKKYRYRWIIENGLKDLVYSYFIDEIYGADPQKIEFEFYCIMAARLAYESFLKELGKKFYQKFDGCKHTLSTMRHLLFEKRNCTIGQDTKGDIVLTFLDPINVDIKNAITELYTSFMENDKNKVLWWKNRKLILDFKNQFDF